MLNRLLAKNHLGFDLSDRGIPHFKVNDLGGMRDELGILWGEVQKIISAAEPHKLSNAQAWAAMYGLYSEDYKAWRKNYLALRKELGIPNQEAGLGPMPRLVRQGNNVVVDLRYHDKPAGDFSAIDYINARIAELEAEY